MKCKLVNAEIDHDYMRELMRCRGIIDFDEYLHPFDSCIQDPVFLSNIEDAAELLNAHIQKYSNIGLVVDADVDGYAIMCLIATMFYVLMPKFIEEGRLCWLRAPLYRLSKGNKRVFAYDDTELAELRKKYPDWEQGRNKGLGEMTSEDMEASMMNKTDRHLEVLTIGDVESAAESLKMLMGPDVDDRRDFLFENVDFSIINN